MRSAWLFGLVAFAGLASGCGDDDTYTGPEVPGFDVEVIADGLIGPTQVVANDGLYVVAVLNGGENDGTGQVLLLDPEGPGPVVLQEGLMKPTGVAVADGQLWIMEQRQLSVASLEPGADRTIIADGLPFNGRSEGTLTMVDGSIVFNTSGRISGGEVVDGSGRLFSVTGSTEPVQIASGFKNAYGRTVGPSGQLWVTEVSDGSFDGEAARDELIEVTPGADHGWPFCVGDNRPVAEFGGTAEACDRVERPMALFDPGATPTSVAVSPWEDDVLLVALWNEGRIVRVERTEGADGPAPVETVVDTFVHPLHLLADGDRLLVTDGEAGLLVALTPSDE